MTCRVATGFVFHDLDFSVPTPTGFAACRRCGGFYTSEQYVSWSCRRPAAEIIPEIELAAPCPLPLGGLRCALCGAPVLVDPRYRAHVQMFGTTCDACALTPTEAVHG